MTLLARRNLFHDRVRLSVTLTGIVFALVLIVVQLGLFLGFTTTTSNNIDHSGVDLWVVAHGVKYFDTGRPFSERKFYQVLATPGVACADKYIQSFATWKRADGRIENIQIIGFNPETGLGGPWNLVAGRVADVKQDDAVIVDDLYREKLGITGLGARVEIGGHRARVTSAEATLRQNDAVLRRVVNGARAEERREALATLKAAEAVRENARMEVGRRQLAAQGVISREEADRHVREFRVARARSDEAGQRYALVEADAREEDRSRAEAEVSLARARLEESRALLETTLIRSSVSGVVLRKHRKAGESVSTQFDSPIVTVADDSKLRVRLDVDETDVGRLLLGQRAYVTAEAFRGRKFWGRVIRIGRVLGKKNIRTDEPTERVDTKILETLVELEDARELPLGLRVDAYVVTGSSPQASAVR